MDITEVMKELESFGNEQTKKTHIRHGAKEPLFGVKVGDLKKIVKKTKKNHELSLKLFDTGNSDAMYLAGLIADEKKITKNDLQRWVQGANWYYLSEYTVPWIASESPHGWELGLQWIASDEESIVASGWSTLGNYVSITEDAEIDQDKIKDLLDYVGDNIHDAKNRVRYAMNQFVISCGCYLAELKKHAEATAKKIGKVSVNVGDTACKVPLASEYISKVGKMGRTGKKRKMARC